MVWLLAIILIALLPLYRLSLRLAPTLTPWDPRAIWETEDCWDLQGERSTLYLTRELIAYFRSEAQP